MCTSVSENRASKYMKQIMTEFKGERDNPTRTVAEFNMLFPDTDRLVRQNSSVKT